MKRLCFLLFLVALCHHSAEPMGISKGVSRRNLLRLDRPDPFRLPKRAATLAQDPDTIFIVAFRVAFSPDSTTLTTGTGEFNSDTSYTGAYEYDQKPHNQEYFSKHLDFLQNYYETVSDGRLVIEYTVYPETPLGAYVVGKEMRDYNPWEQKPEESYCEFGERKARTMMEFVEDAVLATDADAASLGNPFHDATQNKGYDPDRTAYLIIHAGASAFADGGRYQSLGEAARDTPSDFFDFFVSQLDMQLYLERDSIPVDNGSILVRDLMMVSETGNQDSVNFGINGILANQFARQLGVPDLFGASNCFGVSAIGSFCIMDFAGYNPSYWDHTSDSSGLPIVGFVPPYPSAWVRAFLGWTTPTLCRPGHDSTYTVFATNLDTVDEILQVPLNENEYLLIENRQRSPAGSNWFRAETLSTDNETYLGLPILDSIVQLDNSRDDIVVGARNYDAGLPGSGLLVWHIDESVVRVFYEFNMINQDSSRRAVSLLEADGVQDIGAQFANVFGTPVQDYGQPADFFPHAEADRNRKVNSLTSVYTHDGALANLQIRNMRATQATGDTLWSEGHGNENGKRIVNYRSPSFRLDVEWGNSQGYWPAMADSGAAANHLAALDLIDTLSGKEIVGTSRSGKIYVWTSNGIALGPLVDSIPKVNVAGDTVGWHIRTCWADVSDALSTPAFFHDTLVAIGNRNLYYVYDAGVDSVVLDSIAVSFSATTPPLIYDSLVYVGDATGRIHVFADRTELTALNSNTQSPARCLAVADVDQNGKTDVVAAFGNGAIVCMEDGAINWTKSLTDIQNPRLAIGDIDRENDSTYEVVVIDSLGTTYLLEHDGSYAADHWPVKIHRSNTTLPGLADIDGDGYLDLMLAGTNRLYALDRRGNYLEGWPVVLDNRYSYGDIACSPTLADVDGDGTIDAVFGFGATDFLELHRDANNRIDSIVDGSYALGQVTAIDGGGDLVQPFPFTSSTPVRASLLTDDFDGDGTLEMVGVSAGGWVYAWELPETESKSAKTVWLGGEANLQRNPVYPNALMPDAPPSHSQKLAINTFYCYPNPVVNKGLVTLRYELNRPADRVDMFVYDASGEFRESFSSLSANDSWNRHSLNIANYGSGVYRAKVVATQGTTRKVAFCKIAVIR